MRDKSKVSILSYQKSFARKNRGIDGVSQDIGSPSKMESEFKELSIEDEMVSLHQQSLNEDNQESNYQTTIKDEVQKSQVTLMSNVIQSQNANH